MAKRSAGLLIYRIHEGACEILLVHPGGPYWAKKDEGSWSIPKGLVDGAEDGLVAARREAREELGVNVEGNFDHLGEYRQPSGKVVAAWAVEADLDAEAIASNSFQMEWPPHSGVVAEFPEVDKARWFTLVDAERKILKGQHPLIADFVKYRSGSLAPRAD